MGSNKIPGNGFEGSAVWSYVNNCLKFPNAVVLNAVVCRNTQMSKKRAQTQVRKRAQKGAKERFHVKIADNQVETTRLGNSQNWCLQELAMQCYQDFFQNFQGTFPGIYFSHLAGWRYSSRNADGIVGLRTLPRATGVSRALRARNQKKV